MFALLNSYPNPFNPSTSITYTLPYSSVVKMVVYNINGQRVDVIQDEFVQAGRHRVEWTPGTSISSGVYFVELRVGNQRDVMKLGFVK